jgi:hypothetical protein
MTETKSGTSRAIYKLHTSQDPKNVQWIQNLAKFGGTLQLIKWQNSLLDEYEIDVMPKYDEIWIYGKTRDVLISRSIKNLTPEEVLAELIKMIASLQMFQLWPRRYSIKTPSSVPYRSLLWAAGSCMITAGFFFLFPRKGRIVE